MFKWINKTFGHHHDKRYKRKQPTVSNNKTRTRTTVQINGVNMSIKDALTFLKNSLPEDTSCCEQSRQYDRDLHYDQYAHNDNLPPPFRNEAPDLPTLYQFRCMLCGDTHKTTKRYVAEERVCFTCKYPYRCQKCGKGMKNNNFRFCWKCNGSPVGKRYNVVTL